MEDYQLTADPNTIVRASDGAFIPTDPRNLDYVAYLAWLDEGNTAKAYTPPEASSDTPPPAVKET